MLITDNFFLFTCTFMLHFNMNNETVYMLVVTLYILSLTFRRIRRAIVHTQGAVTLVSPKLQKGMDLSFCFQML
jgi:hypothetical protein